LAARHSARFFRDSYVESDTDFPNVPRNTPDLNSPGKADNAFTEAPSYHKVHRNNLLRQRTVPALSASFTGNRLNNTKRLEYNTSATGSSVINRMNGMAVGLISDLTSSQTEGLSFSSWIQAKADGDSNGTKRTIYSIGKVEHDGGTRPLIEFGYEKQTPNCNLFVEIASTDVGGDRTGKFTASISPSTLYETKPSHLVVAFKGTNGSNYQPDLL